MCMRRKRPRSTASPLISGKRRNIERESIVPGTIKTGRRLRTCPAAVEQRKQTVVKDIDEIAQRGVAALFFALPGNLGDVNGQRTVRPEHAEAKKTDMEFVVL